MMAANEAAVRLFVGGVAAGVTRDELAQRFAPFGTVSAVQFVDAKLPGAPART